MITKLFGAPQDPTEWNGKNVICLLCDKEAENFDEHCEEHQPCYYCNEREECDCEKNEKLIEQYNRNRPFNEHIDNVENIKK